MNHLLLGIVGFIMCLWMGFRASKAVDTRLEALNQMADMLSFFESGVVVNVSSLPSLLRQYASGNEGHWIPQLVGNVYQRYMENDPSSLGEIWSKETDAILTSHPVAMTLAEPDQELIHWFGEQMEQGFPERSFEYAQKKLMECMDMARQDKKAKSKLYRTLGLLGGLSIVVIAL